MKKIILLLSLLGSYASASTPAPIFDVEEIINICRHNYAERRSLLLCTRAAAEMVDASNKLEPLKSLPPAYQPITQADVDYEYEGAKITAVSFHEIRNKDNRVVGHAQMMNIDLIDQPTWKLQITVYFALDGYARGAKSVVTVH